MFCPRCRSEFVEGFFSCAGCNAPLVAELPREEPSPPPPSGEPRVVYVSSNVMEAQMVLGLLQSNGVEAFLLDENISRMNAFLTNAVGGVKIVVEASWETQAREILREYLGRDDAAGKLSPFA